MALHSWLNSLHILCVLSLFHSPSVDPTVSSTFYDIHQHYSPCVDDNENTNSHQNNNSHEKTLQPHNIFMAQRAVQMQNMLNKRIQVQFNKEAEVLEEFEGYVTSVHLFNGSFTVHFDDGDVRTLDVKAVDYKLLDDHVFTLSEITTSMKHSKIKVTPKDVCLEVISNAME
eukprot:275367_1